MEYALVDTGVWYALFDNRDQHHAEAREKLELLEFFQLLMPWPVAYETLRTRFVRNTDALRRFERFLEIRRVTYLDDALFRNAAFNASLESSLRGGRPLSMVDCLIRFILDDVNTRVDYLATFNAPDFADVCAFRGIEII